MNPFKEAIANRICVLAHFFPRKKDLWVYGAWEGKLYSDNTKYFYEYMNENHPEINSIWITNNPAIYESMNSSGQKCYLRHSWKGIIAALRAECAFITSEEKGDISPFVNRNTTKIIELWHGIAAKKFGWGTEEERNKACEQYSHYYWMASSQFNVDIFNELLKIPKQRFSITGYPRNDTFSKKPYNENMQNLKSQYEGKRWIIYMPTHRNFGKESVSIEEFFWLDGFLKANNLMMVYKPHFHELKNVLHLEAQFANIIFAKDMDIWGDAYSYVHYFDLLISDYSSIANDYICSGKPVVLYTYDLDRFKVEDAGLCDYFEQILPGPLCYTWEETMKWVVELLKNDTWKDKREECRKAFHPFNDGRNAERVYEAVKRLKGNDVL